MNIHSFVHGQVNKITLCQNDERVLHQYKVRPIANVRQAFCVQYTVLVSYKCASSGLTSCSHPMDWGGGLKHLWGCTIFGSRRLLKKSVVNEIRQLSKLSLNICIHSNIYPSKSRYKHYFVEVNKQCGDTSSALNCFKIKRYINLLCYYSSK